MTNIRLKAFAATVLLAAGVSAASAGNNSVTIWSIGKDDGTANEFALAPDGFRSFLAHDFGYEDSFFVINSSDEGKDFPYALPGLTDDWGGTAPLAGWRPNYVNVLFSLLSEPKEKDNYMLVIKLADYASHFLPYVKVSVNEKDTYHQLLHGAKDLSGQKRHTLGQPTADTLGLAGKLDAAYPEEIDIPLKGGDLKKGGNCVTISIIDGSWILFDNIRLMGPSSCKTGTPDQIFVRSVSAAEYRTDEDVQPLVVDMEHLKGEPVVTVQVDGATILEKKLEKGRYCLEVPMPAVRKETKNRYSVLCNGNVAASGSIVRKPVPVRTLADYVDTRMGTTHSRWMIAPGPWMPFGMVKMSPDNQNAGWQAGYQPTFENVGCFSHVHEWTLGGLGIMATNGELKTVVGDEQNPDEGYRSRIDKRSEQAGIGSYSVLLKDYDIKAEITATTRCGFERFTFPKGREGNRVLVELRPEAEYGILVQDAEFRQVGPNRIEGYCHELSPGVWSNDADQDYKINFVLEFDRPIVSSGCWENGKVLENVSSHVWGKSSQAGFFVTFDTDEEPVVQIRSGISPVSIANASENLEKEIAVPFGWDFDKVVQNQKDVWNDLLGRIRISTMDRLEKARFYTHMYRSICSRNIWSDINGEWVSTDGKLRKVADPSNDVMLGCDAFWNTFWNLNQFWNLVTPEWSGRWVRSELAMYDANGWLAKGPAGLNYIPVMVGEHEIPLMVSAYQMGIRDYDAEKLLEAAVKMQTTPASKVFKGFAGNRDLEAYMKYHYVPYDKGRFSNTMEYSFDDWTVGQLAKSLGKFGLWVKFNERGYWWKNAINENGYCHMRDSKGEWMKDFDPFRSGANRHYVEGNSWQLTFFVPQDIPALVSFIGKERFCDRLLWGFNRDEAFRYNAPGEQYWDHPVVQGNQQSMHFAYMFNYAGQPWNTQRWSRSILDRYYGFGESNAYLGDEDQGQMSAWAVMTALGLFQMDGGASSDPAYEIGSPMFEEAVIDLGGRYGRGSTFTIKARNASKTNIYVQKAKLNGEEWNSFKFSAAELLAGGVLELEMGPEPEKSWGLD